MSRIAVIAHAGAKAVVLFDVVLLRGEIKQVTYCEPINKPGDCGSYECPVVQDRLASGANGIRIRGIDICSGRLT
jgi:hypothetical protein